MTANKRSKMTMTSKWNPKDKHSVNVYHIASSINVSTGYAYRLCIYDCCPIMRTFLATTLNTRIHIKLGKSVDSTWYGSKNNRKLEQNVNLYRTRLIIVNQVKWRTQPDNVGCSRYMKASSCLQISCLAFLRKRKVYGNSVLFDTLECMHHTQIVSGAHHLQLRLPSGTKP